MKFKKIIHRTFIALTVSSWFLAVGQIQAADLGQLGQDLKSKDVFARRKAVLELSRIKDASAVDPLIVALKDEDAGVRWTAANALGELKDGRAVEPLIALLKDKDPNVRLSAVKALGKIKDPRAAAPLLAALDGPNSGDIRKAAMEAIKGISAPSADVMLADLNSLNPTTRANAAKILGELKDVRAVEPLIELLGDKAEVIDRNSAEALGKIGDPRAIDPLIVMLKNAKSPIVAASALVEIGAPAINAVVPLFKDENKSVREYAQQILSRIKDPRSADAAMLFLKDEDRQVRAGAALILKEQKDDRSIEPLIAALKDKDLTVRKNSASALMEFKNKPQIDEAFMEAFKNKDLVVIDQALVFLVHKGIPGSEPILIEALNAFGDLSSASFLLNCGNPELEHAAGEWGVAHGYQVMPIFGVGGGPKKWGTK